MFLYYMMLLCDDGEFEFWVYTKKKKKEGKNNSSILVSDFMVNKCCGKVDE